ncbi:transposase [Ideonella livida]|uniref:Transposase n=1 Tax=Ideonella livida TaxID=2707176 RepID=A0A7C9TJY8_9BURK|nr:transposase [Ideonella livida]NDY92360.1 transposase [Ideonella livida]
MARQARLAVPGLAHCVRLTALAGQPAFLDDEDLTRFRAHLTEAVRSHGVQVHAFCLLPSRVDLLLRPEKDQGLSLAIQALGRRYVASFNLRHGRQGTLWAGRFRACPLQPGSAELAAMAWVESGAELREHLAPTLLQSPASSAMHHLGARREQLVTDPPGYWALGNTPFERELAYRALLGADSAEVAHWAPRLQAGLRGGRGVGEAEFASTLEVQLGLGPRRPRGRPPKVRL